jgi:hypothetical protein
MEQDPSHEVNIPDCPTNKLKRIRKKIPSSIMNAFLERRIDTKTAIRLLEKCPPKGILWAGELAVQEAFKETDSNKADIYFSQAQRLFFNAEHNPQPANSGKFNATMARARIHYAYMPVHREVYQGNLPGKALAESVYWQTLDVGEALSNSYFSHQPDIDPHAREDMIGTLGEVAVLAPLQRFSIYGIDEKRPPIGSDTWFAFLSHISEDFHNSPHSALNYAWDVSVLAKPADQITLDYRIQVKTTDFRIANFKPNDEGIILVCVDPDLRLPDDRQYICATVIKECLAVRDNPNGFSRSRTNLNQRTEKLLDDKLDF